MSKFFHFPSLELSIVIVIVIVNIRAYSTVDHGLDWEMAFCLY